MAIVSGIVGSDGNVYAGIGFTAKQESGKKGVFTITFKPPFNSCPAVAATQIFPWPMNEYQDGGETTDNLIIIFISKNTLRVKTGDSEGAGQYRAFSFVAVGV